MTNDKIIGSPDEYIAQIDNEIEKQISLLSDFSESGIDRSTLYLAEQVIAAKNYKTMSQQDIRRELSGTEFWNEYCSQANCKGDRN